MPNEENNAQGGVDVFTELKRRADSIKAAAEAIDAVAHTLEENASRSVILEVNNTTGFPLTLQGSGDHDWGGFRQLPPDPIAPRTAGLFTSQSNGLLTGTQGNVQYHVDSEGTIFHLEWNNPFVGDNDSLCRVEGTNADFYAAASVTGGGNTNVHMRFMLGVKADASPKQRDWMTCKNCKTLFFALDEGHCAARPRGIVSAPSDDLSDMIQSPPEIVSAPSDNLRDFIQSPLQSPRPAGIETASSDVLRHAVRGREDDPPYVDPATAGMELFGKHEAAGYVFLLPFGIPGPGRQGGWRKCGHCKGLFFDGSDSKGVCPGRRYGHIAEAEGTDFQLVYGQLPGSSQQDNWRFCDKCFGLFYLPHNDEGTCAAEGDHHGASESYVLDHV